VLKSERELPRLALQGRSAEEVLRPAGERLRFRAPTGVPGQDIELLPFHRIAHERYSLYWQLA